MYALVRAAKYLGIPPWQLAEQPAYWTELAVELEQAEFWAQREALKRERGKGRRRR